MGFRDYFYTDFQIYFLAANKIYPSKKSFVMKLAFTLISGLSIILAGILLYNRNSSNNKIKDLQDQLSKCRTGDCNTCKDYGNTPHLQKLNTNMLRDMAYLYQGNIQNTASLQFKGVNREDAKCIWFDLDSVKHFIW